MITFAVEGNIYRFIGTKEEFQSLVEQVGLEALMNQLGIYIRKSTASYFDYKDCYLIDKATREYMEGDYHNSYFVDDIEEVQSFIWGVI